METTTMHRHAHTHTQICQCAHTDSHSVKLELSTLLPSLETVYCMCKPLMQWWVLMPPDKKYPQLNMKEPPPPLQKKKKEREGLSSQDKLHKLHTGTRFHLKKKDRVWSKSTPSKLSTSFLLGARGLFHRHRRALRLGQDKIRCPSVRWQLLQAE